jgi:hypothetical protein
LGGLSAVSLLIVVVVVVVVVVDVCFGGEGAFAAMSGA